MVKGLTCEEEFEKSLSEHCGDNSEESKQEIEELNGAINQTMTRGNIKEMATMLGDLLETGFLSFRMR